MDVADRVTVRVEVPDIRGAVSVGVGRGRTVAPLDVVRDAVTVDVGVAVVGDAVAVRVAGLLGVVHPVAVGVAIEEVRDAVAVGVDGGRIAVGVAGLVDVGEAVAVRVGVAVVRSAVAVRVVLALVIPRDVVRVRIVDRTAAHDGRPAVDADRTSVGATLTAVAAAERGSGQHEQERRQRERACQSHETP